MPEADACGELSQGKIHLTETKKGSRKWTARILELVQNHQSFIVLHRQGLRSTGKIAENQGLAVMTRLR